MLIIYKTLINRTLAGNSAGNDFLGTKKAPEKTSQVLNFKGYSPNGSRTRVTGVRGRRPRPLDDGTRFWLGDQDSNLGSRSQSPEYCRYTIPQQF